MRLFLKVLFYKGSPVLPEKIVEFSGQGGIIGRHASNTLTLEDPDKIVSGRHAEIDFENGQFWIKDISTNGTYLTKADVNLNNAKAALTDNEILRIGEYEIQVEIASEFSLENRQVDFADAIDSPFNDPFNTPFGDNPFDTGAFTAAPEPLIAETAHFRDESPMHDSFSIPEVMPQEKPVKDIADYLKSLDFITAPAQEPIPESPAGSAPTIEPAPALFDVDELIPRLDTKDPPAASHAYTIPKPSPGVEKPGCTLDFK